ncbi:MAG: pimeloyl-ACP methyl ester carboxylesterase [Candidatus Paceibacteria bacterium]|jgi:pimeloyl-ACP methyl ester carboxylesterase
MIIIIPGWMHSAAEWSVVSGLLEQQGVENCVLDLPGFGTVPIDESIKTMSDLTTWCKNKVTQIEENNTPPVTLVGHSCGGRIGLALVAEGMVLEKLVLIGSPNLYRPSRAIQLTKLLVSVMSPVKRFIPESLRHGLRSADYTQAAGTSMQDLYQNVIKYDQTNLLAKVTVPVQLLWGENDTAAPVRIARELDSKLQHSSLEIIPKLGHNLHHENPVLLAGKLKSYVTNS